MGSTEQDAMLGQAQRSRRLATLRGQILRMVYRCQRKRETPPNHVEIHSVLRRLMMKVSLNETRYLLEDLRDRGYLTFTVNTDEDTGYELWGSILATPKGGDLVNGDSTDPVVEV